MADPEIQSILSDPAMRIILEQMQSDPKALQEYVLCFLCLHKFTNSFFYSRHLKNPDIQTKIYKLIESGLISIR